MPHAPDQRASGCRKVLQELVPIPNRSFRHTGRHAEQIPYHFYVGKRKRRDALSVRFMHRDLCFAYPVGFEPTMGKNPRQVNSLMPSTAWLQIQFYQLIDYQTFLLNYVHLFLAYCMYDSRMMPTSDLLCYCDFLISMHWQLCHPQNRNN